MRGRIYVDKNKCLSCNQCRIACAVAHSKPGNIYEAFFEDPPPRSRMRIGSVGNASVPIACRQCEAAACMMVCPTGALSRKNSRDPVVLDNDLCVGCRSCVVVCPYGVPEINQLRSVVAKCDLCIDRLDAGNIPACVEVCKTGTLTFVEDDEGRAEQARDLPSWYRRKDDREEDRS